MEVKKWLVLLLVGAVFSSAALAQDEAADCEGAVAHEVEAAGEEAAAEAQEAFPGFANAREALDAIIGHYNDNTVEEIAKYLAPGAVVEGRGEARCAAEYFAAVAGVVAGKHISEAKYFLDGNNAVGAVLTIAIRPEGGEETVSESTVLLHLDESGLVSRVVRKGDQGAAQAVDTSFEGLRNHYYYSITSLERVDPLLSSLAEDFAVTVTGKTEYFPANVGLRYARDSVKQLKADLDNAFKKITQDCAPFGSDDDTLLLQCKTTFKKQSGGSVCLDHLEVVTYEGGLLKGIEYRISGVCEKHKKDKKEDKAEKEEKVKEEKKEKKEKKEKEHKEEEEEEKGKKDKKDKKEKKDKKDKKDKGKKE